MLGSTIFQRSHSTKSTKSLSAKKRRSTICFDASYCFPPFATPSHLLTTKTPQIFHMWRDILLQREELFRSEPQRMSLQSASLCHTKRSRGGTRHHILCTGRAHCLLLTLFAQLDLFMRLQRLIVWLQETGSSVQVFRWWRLIFDTEFQHIAMATLP